MYTRESTYDSSSRSNVIRKKERFFIIDFFSLSFCRIRAYESNDVDKGSVFEIPVTVVQPIALDAQSNWRQEFDEVVCKPNTILRHFIMVPNNATWAGKYTHIKFYIVNQGSN